MISASILFVTIACLVAVAGADTVTVAINTITTEAGVITIAADAGAITVAADACAGAVTVIVIVTGLICRFNICAPTHRAGGTVICPCVL